MDFQIQNRKIKSSTSEEVQWGPSNLNDNSNRQLFHKQHGFLDDVHSYGFGYPSVSSYQCGTFDSLKRRLFVVDNDNTDKPAHTS